MNAKATEDRGSGRTHRQLEACAQRARDGETMVYVVHTAAMVEHALWILGKLPGATIRRAERIANFRPGRVYVVLDDPDARRRFLGIKHAVEIDHAVPATSHDSSGGSLSKSSSPKSR